MGKEKQFAIAHREILHTSLRIPCRTIKPFLKMPVCLINTSPLISAFQVKIPIRMDTIVKVHHGSKVFRMLRCRRSRQNRALQVTDNSFAIQSFTRIHQINISDNRTFLIYITRRKTIKVFTFRQLSV